jgi:hypothetical protein
MRKQITRWALLALVAGGLTPPRAHAMGAQYYTVDGQPFFFHDVSADVPLWYDIDTGGLGSMTHSQAETMVNQAFQAWQSIPTAGLFFHRVTSSDVLAVTGDFKPVTVANVDDFFNGGAPVEVTTPVLLVTR